MAVVKVAGIQSACGQSREENISRAADLARLATGMQAHRWVTATVLCRFLRAYRRQLPAGQPAWKSLWRDAARRSRRITCRKLRRGDRVL